MTRDRTLATVLFTDIVDSTARASALGDDRWRQLLARHDALIRDHLRRHRGVEVNTAGDGFVARFEDPERALFCAAAIRDAVRELDLEVRCGLHMGQVEGTGKALGGIAAHIGARVAEEAGPGEVLVSRSLRDGVQGSGFTFDDRGARALKGIPGEWRLYSLTGLPEGAVVEEGLRPWSERLPALLRGRTGWAAAALVALALVGVAIALRERGADLGSGVASAESAGPGVAILPFGVNDPELERWREGMVDLLSTNLDGAAGLRAIDSRTVLARWRETIPAGSTPDLASALDVASTTGARYALVGNVVSSGTDMRLVADVYDLEERTSLGQEMVEGAPDSVFALVDRLSIRLLALVLESDAGDVPRVDLARVTTASLPALKAYLAGESAFRRSDFDRAIPAYESAVDADSTFALALYRIAETLGWKEGSESGRAFEYLERAARLSDRLPTRDRELFDVLRGYYRGAPDVTARALAVTEKYPDDPQAWYLLGEAYFHRGYQSLPSREDTEAAFERATRLDPTFSPAYIHLLDLAIFNADSAAAVRTLARYRRIARGSVYESGYEAVVGIAFGGPAVRRAVIAALDTIPAEYALRVVHSLHHPRFADLQADLLARISQRPDASTEDLHEELVESLIRRGRIAEALVHAEGVTDPFERIEPVLFAYFNDAPLEPEVYAAAFALGPADTLPTPKTLVAAIYAIDRGRRSEAEALERMARKGVEALRAAGDTLTADQIETGIRVVAGRAAMKEGENERALELLENAFREGGIPIVGWIMELHTGAGRPEEAVRYGRAPGPDPWIGLALGRLYEETGEREKAIEAYSWVVLAWERADPALQPQYREAQAHIARLEGLQRG